MSSQNHDSGATARREGARRNPPSYEPEETFSDFRGHRLSATGRGCCARLMASALMCTAARRLAWSANPVVARAQRARTILQLYRPTEGSVIFEGQELSTMSGKRTFGKCVAACK